MIFSQPPAQRTLRGRPLGRPSQKRPPKSTGASDSEMAPQTFGIAGNGLGTAALPKSPPAQGPNGRDDQRSSLDCAAAPVEPQRPPDVGDPGLSIAQAHERVIDQRLSIDARSGELEAER